MCALIFIFGKNFLQNWKDNNNFFNFGYSFKQVFMGKNGPLPSILEIICLETLFPNYIAMYHFFRKRRYRAWKRHYRA